MKNILLILLLAACSHQLPKEAVVKSSRLPTSAQEFQNYEFGNRSEIRFSANKFVEADLTDHSFTDFLAMAQRNDYKKITIDPFERSPFKKVSTVDDASPAGDFIVLVGTNFSNTDDAIRKGDYDDIYETVKRLSWLKFRTTINLVASVTDLRKALQNDRPTIIMWTSHGNENYFYDFNQIRIPYSVFKGTSSQVYQFILTSCNGFTAMQNGYKEFIPKTMKYWGWQRLVYHPSDVKSHFESRDWNPYINYPSSRSYNGMVCKSTGAEYAVFNLATGDLIPGTARDTFENCMYGLMNSDKDYICSRQSDGWGMYNLRLKAIMPGTNFDQIYDCASRINNSIQGKVCRRFKDNIVYQVDSNNKVSPEKFNDIDPCFNAIHTKNQEI